MGRTGRWVGAGWLVLALGVAACGSDDDGGGVATQQVGPSGDDGGGNDNSDNSDGGDAQEYVDAVAGAVRYDDPDDGYDIPLSEDAAACYGEAYVAVVGIERLAAEATPEEIEANPEEEATHWGIEVTDAEGTQIFRSLVDCAPTAMEEIGQVYAEQLGSSGTPIEVDAACLGRADPAAVEELVGSSIASDDSDPTEEQAGRLIDWLSSCGDLRGSLLASISSDPGLPEGAAECIDAAIDDETLRDLMVAFMLGEGGAAIEPESPAGAALNEVASRCEHLDD